MRDALPFVAQGLVLFVDEFWFHHRRGLGRWERLGHPIDTATFVACLAWVYVTSPSQMNLTIYVVLAVASCLVVTKDEWEHAEKCDGFENWLHALLFMLHPTLLIWAGHLWWGERESASFVIGGALAMASAFCIYQLTYWNWWRAK